VIGPGPGPWFFYHKKSRPKAAFVLDFDKVLCLHYLHVTGLHSVLSCIFLVGEYEREGDVAATACKQFSTNDFRIAARIAANRFVTEPTQLVEADV